MSIEDQIDSAKKIIGSEITNVNSNSLLIKSGGCASCHILFKLIESLSLNESDATDLLSEVLYQDAQLNERFIELAFEGQRIHNLKRLHLPTIHPTNGTFEWNDNKLVFPIPQREIDATNGVLVQNPGY